MHGVSDAGTRLLLFGSGTQSLNEELGRHRGREGKSECVWCGAECESVVHVLWECSAYSNIRATFVEKFREVLGDRYAEFDKLNSIEKTAYVLGSELWEYDFDHLLSLVKEYVVGVWDVCKQNCTVMTGAQVNFSPWLRICSWLELRGKRMVSSVPQVREEQMVRICLCIHVCVALPMIVGAWSMAVMLW